MCGEQQPQGRAPCKCLNDVTRAALARGRRPGGGLEAAHSKAQGSRFTKRQPHMGLKKGVGVGVVAVWVAGSLCSSQTNDEFYRSWRWTEEVTAPRAAGLGGAYVALADDSAAAQLNPAGLTLLPKTEITGGFLWRGSGALGRDSTMPRTGMGLIGGAGLLTKEWALGGYLTEPFDERVVLPVSGTSGRLETTVTDGGVALGWAPAAQVRVGLRVSVTHVRVEGQWARANGSSTSLLVGAAAGITNVTGAAGILVECTERLRLGASFRQGASWDISRTASNPALGVAVDTGSIYRYRSPSIVSAGASLRAGLRVVLTTQVDFVRFSEVRDVFGVRIGAFAVADYALRDALEGRLGVEFSQPVGRLSVQVRAGAHGASGASFRYIGADRTEANRFRGSERMTEWSAGASLVLASGSRLDVAVMSDKVRTVASGAATLRF
jgi:hypothetical protein